MGRLSRGCLRCRQRRVRCDEGRPSCQRCIQRNEVCEGYRDESSLIFRYETEKVIEYSRAKQMVFPPSYKDSSHSSPQKRSKFIYASSASRRRHSVSGPSAEPSSLTLKEASGITLRNPQPWLKGPPARLQPPLEQQAIDQFIDRYVLYPCNQTSCPGFLEHLPCMFNEVNVEGRYALRWAVQAAAFADISKNQESNALASKAFQCYGMALSALGESLSTPGKEPDDYDLMTVVVLDIFETLYTPNKVSKGSHVQGMAQILRLRGSDLVYNSRGWSLFRLAQHRIQKHRLTYDMQQIPETSYLLKELNDSEPSARLEKNADDIGGTCKRARTLLGLIIANRLPASTVVDMIKELHSSDQEAVSWRQTSQWSFTTFTVSERPDLSPAARGITETIQLHSDVWMAYEWNYHRTARIAFLQQLLQCSKAALETPDLEEVDRQTLSNTIAECISTVQWLADEFLATVPQSFGDVNHMGLLHDCKDGPPRCRAIGGYLLLWPTRVVKAETSATSVAQKERAWKVFEKIRECTGMKDLLGDKSII
ncbi:hypothetical protein M441DRAFT_52466 [Trichoderma asperellum CBS 433.97]|uniref:Zn(2)-C6 fungal-type domain-containing protein n=1 Tax=Trichoderma asperellum (strain ATCC 204424 / CBS 433.97 / NBRC 101777) TaxID=1042311 RepID=A0A2T3YR78_TRIA4|nr:hypothetical protein M441DRAFT_52466 [Trichoderma asperellum CBS 433.97]PTB35024.1 hypothetical protein M441DRAFT_52466 [Trichoderma asperellum CBS 433.97]